MELQNVTSQFVTYQLYDKHVICLFTIVRLGKPDIQLDYTVLDIDVQR